MSPRQSDAGGCPSLLEQMTSTGRTRPDLPLRCKVAATTLGTNRGLLDTVPDHLGNTWRSRWPH